VLYFSLGFCRKQQIVCSASGVIMNKKKNKNNKKNKKKNKAVEEAMDKVIEKDRYDVIISVLHFSFGFCRKQQTVVPASGVIMNKMVVEVEQQADHLSKKDKDKDKEMESRKYAGKHLHRAGLDWLTIAKVTGDVFFKDKAVEEAMDKAIEKVMEEVMEEVIEFVAVIEVIENVVKDIMEEVE
jgi:hypothetical protein